MRPPCRYNWNAIHEIVSNGGRIDVLVNNAVYARDLAMEEIKAQYGTNVFEKELQTPYYRL
jgi:NAD(P)-dependent dehydrogenase (short-subunit alcohol dehydrogenase family)